MRIGWSFPFQAPSCWPGRCGVRVAAAPGPTGGHCREAGPVLTPIARKAARGVRPARATQEDSMKEQATLPPAGRMNQTFLYALAGRQREPVPIGKGGRDRRSGARQSARLRICPTPATRSWGTSRRSCGDARLQQVRRVGFASTRVYKVAGPDRPTRAGRRQLLRPMAGRPSTSPSPQRTGRPSMSGEQDFREFYALCRTGHAGNTHAGSERGDRGTDSAPR